MTTETDNTQGQATDHPSTTSPAPQTPLKSSHLSIALRPPQRAILDGFVSRYGINQTILVHMLIDMEAEAHRLPQMIVKALRLARSVKPPAAPAPLTPVQNN